MVSGGVWVVCEGVWRCINTKSFAKDYVRLDIAFSSNALLYLKLPMSGGIWMVSGWCLGVTWWCLEVSGWCARVSGDVSIPSTFSKDYVRSDIAFSSNAVLYAKMVMSEGV